MEEIVNLILEHAHIVYAIIQLVIAGLLAYYTRNLYLEAKKQRDRLESPDIIVTAEPSKSVHSLFYLVVTNVGMGTGYKICVEEVSDAIHSNEDKYQWDLGSFLKDFTLAPGQSRRHYMGSIIDLFDKSYKFKVSVQNLKGKNINNIEYEIVMKDYEGLGFLPEYDGGKELSEIKTELRRLVDMQQQK